MGTFAKGTRQDVQDAIAAARAAFPAWGRRPWQERVAIMRRVADLISERQMEFAALHVDRGRQEPTRGARRRRGDGRPHPLVRATGWRQHDGFDHPMGNLGDDDRPHALGPQAVRRVGA